MYRRDLVLLNLNLSDIFKDILKGDDILLKKYSRYIDLFWKANDFFVEHSAYCFIIKKFSLGIY